MNINEFNPTRVWHYFSEISKIPRESGNEAAVSDYLYNVALTLGLKAVQEPCGNVVIYKPATAGYEQADAVILQGHMDMVCVKDATSQHDFTKDPIELIVDGDLLKANGTTLGADNGIAVAMAMAILEDNSLHHPALTVLLTVSEETGMDGAMAADPANLIGTRLINIDSEEEGFLLASNAGGADVDVDLPINWQNNNYQNAYKVTIKNLKGGHSGLEIDKKRANAIKLIGRLLTTIECDVAVFAIEGGQKMNAIAQSATVSLASNASVEEMLAALEPIEKMFKDEYAVSDPDITISYEKTEKPVQVFKAESTANLAKLLLLLPQGVIAMSQSIDGLVETSNNVGIIAQRENKISICNALRSSVASRKDLVHQQIEAIANLVGGMATRHGDYPEWAYKIESPLRDTLLAVYQQQFGKEMIVDAIHAGLECGLFAQKMPQLDMVSIGPNMWDVHSPRERVSISSTERTYNYLVNVLAALK